MALLGHPVPDGVVFRGIQVVVRSERIEIRYQVGLHDNMVQREWRERAGTEMDFPGEAVEALARYRDLMFSELPEKIAVAIDGQPKALVPQRADIVRQPHAQLEFVYVVPFQPGPNPSRFVFQDGNYEGVPGYHLVAIRSRGDVDVLAADSGELPGRLPTIPTPADNTPEYPEPTRRIEAYLSSSFPTAATSGEDQTAEAAGADSPAASSTDHSSAAEPAAVGIESDAVDQRRAGGESPATAERAAGDRSDQPVAVRKMVWIAVFACVAVLIALAWIITTFHKRERSP
jgi:hypothetical protein